MDEHCFAHPWLKSYNSLTINFQTHSSTYWKSSDWNQKRKRLIDRSVLINAEEVTEETKVDDSDESVEEEKPKEKTDKVHW